MQFFSPKSNSKITIVKWRKFLIFLLVLAAIGVGFLGFWFVSRIILNTDYPVLSVSSSNMCLFQPNCNSLTHLFERTLHLGDLIIVQGVNAKNVSSAYPNSDILVFHSPKIDSAESDSLIIRRVITKEERNGTFYFRTKSDGVGVHMWPEMPDVPECDHWYDYRENYTWTDMISEKLLVGKVIFRIPLVGYILLFVQSSFGMLIIAIFIIIALILQFAIPKFASKKVKTEPKKNGENAFET